MPPLVEEDHIEHLDAVRLRDARARLATIGRLVLDVPAQRGHGLLLRRRGRALARLLPLLLPAAPLLVAVGNFPCGVGTLGALGGGDGADAHEAHALVERDRAVGRLLGLGLG